MSNTAADPGDPPLLDEQTARANADALRRIGEEHGISDLRFASPGRLVARVDGDRDMIDMADFTVGLVDQLDRYAEIISDSVLSRPGVSPDLVTARPI